jgi:uncharacterized protein YgiM (DUF1202 family)
LCDALADDVTEVVQEIRQSSSASAAEQQEAEFPEQGFVVDPDGFTNVRSGPGKENPVVCIVKQGEPFRFRRDSSSWWRVKTQNGTVGFVHSSRISSESKSVGKPLWLFADSSSRQLSSSELQSLSADDLWRARNEIFARRGLVFQSSRGRKLTSKLGASYQPVSADQDYILAQMNPIERQNIILIEAEERRLQAKR